MARWTKPRVERKRRPVCAYGLNCPFGFADFMLIARGDSPLEPGCGKSHIILTRRIARGGRDWCRRRTLRSFEASLVVGSRIRRVVALGQAGTKGVACVGVGKAGFPLKGAASVSPDGELGYGVNWGLGATQVPKFRRFRCLVEISHPGVRPRWSVIDLIPQGRLRDQRLLIPVATGIGVSAKR